ncbi:MAG: ABC transporter substrate-binding protein [Planktomarina sp.]
MNITTKLLSSVALMAATSASAAELEVTHWWTSGGEAAAVTKIAEAFNVGTDHSWIDGAIAGGGGTSIPAIISRIIGGDPMGATQLNHGRQAQELIEAGMMTDLTELAEAQGWRDIVHPVSLLDSCTVDGRVYCVPMNIHSAQWLWVSHGAFETAGLPVPTNWDEFVAGSAKLQEAGIVPLAMGQQGWQQSIAFGALTLGIVGVDSFLQVTGDKDAEEARGEAWTRAFEAVAKARELARDSKVQDWNIATNMVIQDTAGGQIMGDWAQGEFQVAGEVAGEDYSCLPGMGINEILDTGGDAFYFPVIEDEAQKAAQLELASLLISKEMQVDFNLAKGSLPVRGDIDLSAANDCMQKGLKILADGGIMPSNRQTFDADSDQQINDLMSEFWATDMSAAAAQAAYVSIIENAE